MPLNPLEKKKVQKEGLNRTWTLGLHVAIPFKVQFGVLGRANKPKRAKKKIISPALKDNISRGIRWHLSRRQTDRFPVVRYLHNSKHRETSTTANKDKFLSLHLKRPTLLQDNTFWAVSVSFQRKPARHVFVTAALLILCCAVSIHAHAM